MNKKLAAIILAAGQGKRMQSKDLNKVVLPLAGKPMILHEIEFLRKIHISPIVVVVGFAKESVEKTLAGQGVQFAHQKQQMGTGDAVSAALPKIPKDAKDVMVIQGDDSMFYQEKNSGLIQKIIEKHQSLEAQITFLTVTLANPYGMGRIIRNEKGDAIFIVEEKDASGEQRKIKEVNAGCYIFNVDFLKIYLEKIKKSKVTGEYYLVSLVDIAAKNNIKIETLQGGDVVWKGVNTREDLQEAESLLAK